MRLSLFYPRRPEDWVCGHALLTGEEIAVPLGLVALWDPSFDPLHNLRSFQVGSNGLASGNILPEAIVSALDEVIERDAVTSHKVAGFQTGRFAPRVRLETMTAPWCGTC